MNYYRPRQLINPEGKPSGIWHYTCMNDGKIWALGYCAKGGCKHTSPLEASDCYRKYIREKCRGMLPGGFPMGEDEDELIMSSSY